MGLVGHVLLACMQEGFCEGRARHWRVACAGGVFWRERRGDSGQHAECWLGALGAPPVLRRQNDARWEHLTPHRPVSNLWCDVEMPWLRFAFYMPCLPA
jgi:hypothetical protein